MSPRIVAHVSNTSWTGYGGSGVVRTSCHQARTNVSTAAAWSAGRARQSTRLRPLVPEPTPSMLPSAIARAVCGSRRRITAAWSSKWVGTR
ncbi:hypothetical protein AQJ91_44450 [Streptomyces dysideae]|uniref:Uncharacterized protein n=1 Tax=Streptomyces dysideae TaxID=909626 RepID=A0A117RXE2_9ACTN|nr:hypothetical protein AQJ91_44450 [Streptomyces dysideae]